ncbi:MAG: DUF6033 family protein [Eubacteriales bacterium]|nr:DUF6033 family protein [Eubacteriales bacterium]
MASMYGVSAYQQTNEVWNRKTQNTNEISKDVKTAENAKTSKQSTDVKTSTWKPIDTASSLVPANKTGVGMAIGDVQLSDKAKEYYEKLKSKFHNMEFIAVSQDMKSKVHANAAAYGNANKQVVLIDDAKLEQMANDESFRKKYEGIIAMSQTQLTNAKNSLASSGANVKNFGMSVNSDGTTSFFATLEKSSNDQAKIMEKKQAEKKAAKAKEKKQAEKKAKEEKLEKTREENRVKQKELKEGKGKDDKNISETDEKEYVEIKADSMDDLVSKVSKYAYDNSANSVMTDEEMRVGQNFDFKG